MNTETRTRLKRSLAELRNFKKVVTALGADPDAAVTRANDILDEYPNPDDMDGAEAFLQVLAELVDSQGDDAKEGDA